MNNSLSRVVFTLVFSCVLLSSARPVVAYATTSREIEAVAQDIYRGPRPSSDEDFLKLQKLGVKTILSLMVIPMVIHMEERRAAKFGIKVIDVPMIPMLPVSKESLVKALRVMADHNNHAIYIHCLLSLDRTGLLVGLYRVHVQHWSAQDAYQEMEKDHFSKWRVPFLERTFWKYSQEGSLGELDFDEESLLEDLKIK